MFTKTTPKQDVLSLKPDRRYYEALLKRIKSYGHVGIPVEGHAKNFLSRKHSGSR
jgi:hypothetical protein